jgi:hypothetical protein
MVIRLEFVKTIVGGIGMNAENLWQAFLSTGAPELYLLYVQAKRVEDKNVFNSSGIGFEGDELQ